MQFNSTQNNGCCRFGVPDEAPFAFPCNGLEDATRVCLNRFAHKIPDYSHRFKRDIIATVMELHFLVLGDSAVTVSGAFNAADARDAVLNSAQPGVIDAVAAFDSLTIYYDIRSTPGDFRALRQWIEQTIRSLPADGARTRAGRVIEIPVIYDGPDLPGLADSKSISASDLIKLHTSVEYVVGAVGFLPGFAYLQNLPPVLHSPRRATPRTSVPAGSVGIGGPYTGVYPCAAPGGWQLIGRTTLKMFDLQRRRPSLLQAGTRVRFRAVDLDGSLI